MKGCIIVTSMCGVDVAQGQKYEATSEERTHDSAVDCCNERSLLFITPRRDAIRRYV